MKQYPFLAAFIILMYVAGFACIVGGVLFSASEDEIMYLVIGLALAPNFLIPADYLRLQIDMRQDTQASASVLVRTYQERHMKKTLSNIKTGDPRIKRIAPNGKQKVRTG